MTVRRAVLRVLVVCLPVLLVLSPSSVPAQSDQLTFENAKQSIESITGKPFREPITLQPQSRDEFQTYLKKQLRVSFDRKELAAFSTIYDLLGLLPEDYSLNDKLLELYRSQAGAYYHPPSGSIRTLGDERSKAQMYFIYLHELVHAHQDQHYPLMKNRHERMTRSFDSIMAYNFVIEGHANLVSMVSQLGIRQLSNEYFASRKHLGIFRMLTRFTSIDASQLKLLETMAGSSGMTRNLEMIQNTPGILVKQMLDPYFWGQYYWYEKAAGSSWDRTLDWLNEPPTQTRTILYREIDDPPGDETSTLSAPTRSKFSDSMGVYFLLRWLGRLDDRPQWGKTLIEDRLALVTASNDSYLAWKLRFTDPDHAERFLGTIGPTGSENAPSGGSITLQKEYGTVHLTPRKTGSSVTLYLEDDPEREPYGPSRSLE